MRLSHLTTALLSLSLCLPLPSTASHTCQNLSSVHGIVELSTYYITNVTSTPADNLTNTPAFCALQVVIGDRINAWVHLPETSAWNGRFVQFGCGGACGYNSFEDGDAGYGGPGAGVRGGFVVGTTDMGVPTSDDNFAPFHDDFQMRVDWGHLATHLTAVVSKDVVEMYYGAAPSFSYHLGGSTGGRQGLVEAQRYPEDFNGVVAVAPAYNETGVTTYQISWNAKSVVENDTLLTPILTATDAALINAVVLAACDTLDGLRDGIISHPRSCHFNLSTLLCPANSTATTTNTTAATCLTPSALAAAEKLYSGPISNTGAHQVLEGLLPGSEAVWNGSYISTSASTPSPWYAFASSFLSYYAFWPDPGVALTPSTLNLSDPELLRQTSRMESLEYGGVADLGKFEQLGGKLMVFQGLMDTAVAPWFARDYFERVGMAVGEGVREGFVRFFEMPGVEHVSGGPGADTYDSLALIVDWVENGKAPDKVIAAHYDSEDNLVFERPLFPFPLLARYDGVGNVSSASSFEAVNASEPYWSL